MNRRTYVRYGSEHLPAVLGKVTVSWRGAAPIDSYVIDYSAQGISVVIPVQPDQQGMPRESEIVKVLLPVNKNDFTGTCIHVSTEPDGSTSLGIFFADPAEQSMVRTMLFNSLNSSQGPHAFVSYEWEELVGRLCDSDDPKLQRLGHLHLARMKAHQTDLQM